MWTYLIQQVSCPLFSRGLDNNYCRNPDNERMPWCYTTDNETRWEYCKVTTCGDGAGPGEQGFIEPCNMRDCTKGSANLQRKEFEMLRNSDVNPSFRYQWSKPVFLPLAADDAVIPPEEENCYEGDGASYRGITSETISGKRCQAWSSMAPHSHVKTPRNFPKAWATNSVF